jgi:alpha-galactosidase
MDDHEIWAKPLSNSEIAVCFLNRSNQSWKLDYSWQKEIMYFATQIDVLKKVYNLYDLWEHRNIGKTSEKLVKEIPAHGVVMVRLSQQK